MIILLYLSHDHFLYLYKYYHNLPYYKSLHNRCQKKITSHNTEHFRSQTTFILTFSLFTTQPIKPKEKKLSVYPQEIKNHAKDGNFWWHFGCCTYFLRGGKNHHSCQLCFSHFFTSAASFAGAATTTDGSAKPLCGLQDFAAPVRREMRIGPVFSSDGSSEVHNRPPCLRS